MKKKLFVLAMSIMILGACSTTGKTASPTATTYPDEVPWELAVEILNSGEVESISQYHNLEVTLVLKAGTQIKTVEPSIDAVFQEIEKCGLPCSDIIKVTE